METSNLAQFYFDLADVFLVAVNSREVVVDVNKKALQILGYPKGEVVGKNWFESFVPAIKRAEAKRLFHDMLGGTLRHVHYEHPVAARNGEEVVFNFHNVLVTDTDGTVIGVLSSGEDVTARSRKVWSQNEVENRLQVTLDYMIEGYQIIDYDWRYLYVNDAAAKQGRKSKEALLGYTMMQVYPGIDKTLLFSYLQSSMTNRISHQVDNEFTYPDGSKGWFELRIEPIPEGILILSLDATKKRDIETELSNYRGRLEEVVAVRTSECAKINEQLSLEVEEHRKTVEGLKLRAAVLDNTLNAIFLVNTKGDFAYANDAASKAYGYSVDEFLNLNIAALLPPSDASSVKDLLSRIMLRGQANLEMVHLRKDGAKLPVKLASNLVKTEHGQFILFVIQRLYHR
ncbi:MAG: PAS domain S-box protein [Candidatus Bathyarchaeota archaeon]|nr:PAS domain S-box protein [Candidatus Bathyarchaeota archaeon]